MRRIHLAVISAALAILLFLASCSSAWGQPGRGGMMGSGGMMGGFGPGSQRSYSSNGERVYYTGLSSSGRPIPFSGSPMWLSMHGGSCASCHGEDGRGGIPMMMGTAVAPDISYHALTEESVHSEDGHAHEPYTDKLIKRAIVEGLDPKGEPLDPTMPRWQMSERDLEDLIEYLKTFLRTEELHNESRGGY